MRAALFLLALFLGACRGQSEAPAPAKETKSANGAISPAGERHPGTIAFDDKVDKRQWTRKAAEVPPTIAWVESDDEWIPVVRIEITGIPKRREMKKYGPKGRFLTTTMQGPPRRQKP